MRSYPEARSGKLLINQAMLNYQLRRAQLVIENFYGFLVARWRLFRKAICVDKENVASYILAGVALHNLLQQSKNASYCPRGFVDSEANDEFWPGE